jgi:hypothetical protein
MSILHIIETLNPGAGGPAESVRGRLGYGPIGDTGEVVRPDDPSVARLADFGFPVHALSPINTTCGFNSTLLSWLRANRHRFGVVVNGRPAAVERQAEGGRCCGRPNRAHPLPGNVEGRWQVGHPLRIRDLHPSAAPGELRHGGGGADRSLTATQ